MAKIKKEDLLPQAEKILKQYFTVRKIKDGSLLVSKRGLSQKKKTSLKKGLNKKEVKTEKVEEASSAPAEELSETAQTMADFLNQTKISFPKKYQAPSVESLLAGKLSTKELALIPKAQEVVGKILILEKDPGINSGEGKGEAKITYYSSDKVTIKAKTEKPRLDITFKPFDINIIKKPLNIKFTDYPYYAISFLTILLVMLLIITTVKKARIFIKRKL